MQEESVTSELTAMTPDDFRSAVEGKPEARGKYPHCFREEEAPGGSTVSVVHFSQIKVSGVIRIADIPGKLPAIYIKNAILDNLLFENCQAGHIYIDNSSFGDINIAGPSTVVEYIRISGGSFKTVAVYDNAKCRFLAIEKNDDGEPNVFVDGPQTVLDYLKFQEAKIGMLELARNATAGEIDIERSVARYIKLFENTSLDNLQITDNSTCLRLDLETVTINERLSIRDSTINYFWFQVKGLLEGNIDNSTIQVLKYKALCSTVFNISYSKMIEFSLQRIRTGKDGLIQLINCAVNTLEFDTVLNLASINIKDLTPLKSLRRYKHYPGDGGEGAIVDWYETGEFTGVAQINIFNSDIGKTMFSSNLSGFDKFCFSNSKIIEAFIAGPRLPDIYARPGENEDEQKRIAYSQIKRIYENRGDTITAMKYFRLEMEIYHGQLKNNLEDKIPGEKFQLLFNQFTNRHGTEWQKALMVTLLSSVLLYAVYCTLLFGFDFHGHIKWRLLPYYFEFVNPTHKIDFLKQFAYSTNTVRDSIALVLDSLCRITVPLLLYQMIQAFRKYGRK